MDRIFVFVIGSFEQSCYYKFIKMRKEILKKYKIAHRFLFDDNIPGDYTLDDNDIVIPKTSYTPFPTNTSIPHMTLKFLKGLAHINLENYDYIIRVNLSTYINFNKLQNFLESAPREKYAAGYTMCHKMPEWTISPVEPVQFISGTCMIFSKDVVMHFKEIPYDDPIILTHNDDVILSHIAKNFTNSLSHIPMLMVENDNVPTTEQIETYSIFRIRHWKNRERDISQWTNLMKLIDFIYISENFLLNSTSNKPIIISQPWGGLGDNLAFSTLPKLYSELGYDVYISSSNAYRNPEIYDLVWKLNPYVKGISDLPANAGSCKGLTYYTDYPYKNIELTHKLANGTALYPEIYYRPSIIKELSNTIIIDLTSISSSYTDDFISKIINNIDSDYPNFTKKIVRFKNIHNRNINILNYEYINIDSIFHYSDIIASCKVFVCLHSGCSVLASALKQDKSTPEIRCFHHTKPSRPGLMYFFSNIQYSFF